MDSALSAPVGARTARSFTAPAVGLEGWAIRTGRALDRWGRARLARRNDRARLLGVLAARTAADAAVAQRDALHRSAGHLPL